MLNRTYPRYQSVVVVAVVLAGGCGPAATTASDAGPDPLIGTWFAQITPPTADDQSETFTFRADRSLTAVHSQHNSPTSMPGAGCIELVTELGTYTTSGGTLTVTAGASGTSTVTTMGCTDPTEDMTGPYAGTGSLPASGTAVPYSVTSDTLVLSGTTFTRR